MTAKPHRYVLDRVSGYAEEAAAYLRRRRLTRRPFARVAWPGGRAAGLEAETEQGRRLFLAAAELIDLARAEADADPEGPGAGEGAWESR